VMLSVRRGRRKSRIKFAEFRTPIYSLSLSLSLSLFSLARFLCTLFTFHDILHYFASSFDLLLHSLSMTGPC
jgi:hypothetical protein